MLTGFAGFTKGLYGISPNSINILNEKILLINVDENSETIRAEKIINFKSKASGLIKKLEPYLIIVTSQNSLSRTKDHFQHYFGEELEKIFSNENKYKRLAKIDATKPIHSSGISSIFSKILKNPDPYNVRTRIYYRTDKVCLNFKDEELSEKSCFTNKKSVSNEYNSNRNSTQKSVEECMLYGSDITITNYYMKRYSSPVEEKSKTGNGIIAIGLIFKIKDDKNFYKLIINNRCNIESNLLVLNKSKPISSPIKSSFYIVSSNSIIKTKTNSDFEIKTLQLNSNLNVIYS